MKIFIAAILIFICLPAFAMTSAEREYSNELALRATPFVRLFDPAAEVSIETESKPFASQGWAGIKTADQVKELVTKISDRDVKSVHINIFSTKKEITTEFKKQLIEFINLPPAIVNIRVRNVSDLATPVAEEKFSWGKELVKTIQGLVAKYEPQIRYFSYGLILFGILFLLEVGVLGITSQKKLGMIQSAISAKESEPNREPVRAQAAEPAVESQQRKANENVAASASDVQNLRALSTQSWINLLSDCYWCEQDRYAAWLWQNMPQENRKQVLDSWPIAQNYVEYVTTLKPEERGDHNHPVYIEPQPLSFVSQSDLQQFVKKQPKIWRALSPMRRLSMSLSVADMLTLQKENGSESGQVNLQNFAQQVSKPRNLPQTWYKKSLSAEDEIFLLNQYHEVPPSSRVMMVSWVWTVLIPQEEARKILNTLSASELASAWVGCEEVLKRLQELIPEQKMKMIEDYRRSANPSWSSPVLIKVTRQSCKILEATSVESHKAA